MHRPVLEADEPGAAAEVGAAHAVVADVEPDQPVGQPLDPLGRGPTTAAQGDTISGPGSSGRCDGAGGRLDQVSPRGSIGVRPPDARREESSLAVEPPLRVEHREELVWLLVQACELEHGLMCEYLFAQFTLKHTGQEGSATSSWPRWPPGSRCSST